MISWLDVYHVFSATVPLYVSMILGYLSVKHLNLFSLEQCAGINKFVAKFSIPLLSFQVISQNNPFKMSPRLILSDILQKILAAVVLAAILRFWHPTGGRGGKLGWIITGLSVSVLPNTLILGIPINLFSLEQCAGINKFVAKFSIPLLSFQVISQNNPFKMSPRLILSDILQKILAAVVLAAVLRFWHPTGGRGGKLGWIITGLSVSVLPNTLILGIPILSAIDGDAAVHILVQIVVLQSLIWYNLLLFLFEINAAREVTPSGASIEHRGNENEEADIEQEPKEEVAIVRTRSPRTGKILLKAWRKFISNPNTYAALFGLVWATLHFRLGWKLPVMIDKSVHMISDGGLGMAMFSLGLFMASQSSIIACGTKMAIITMVLKFVLGPALMIASAFSIRLRSTLFRVTILQAALPQGIVPFVFAKEYNVNPEIASTGVIFGMLISLPITLAYYFVLDL